MAFNNQYKSLAEVLKKYQIQYARKPFVVIKDTSVPAYLKEDITFTLENIPYNVSEAAICENLIYPILKAAWKLEYTESFSLWSHQAINYNDQLTGIPDYLFSKRSTLGKIFFEYPFVAVVEAKKDNFTEGWAQCALEMYAIQQINQNPTLSVFGIVTNGETWEFAELQSTFFTEYRPKGDIEQLQILFNIILSVLEYAKRQTEI
jgi:hypothetical protein